MEKAIVDTKTIKLNNARKTKSSLEWLFDHPEMVEHGQEYVDSLLEQDKEGYDKKLKDLRIEYRKCSKRNQIRFYNSVEEEI